MGKKRKAGGRPYGETAKAEMGGGRSKFAADERFADSADEFEEARDKVLLEEGPEAKRRRKLAEQEEFFEPSDEEVLGYESDSTEDEELGEDDYDEDDGGRPTSKKSGSRKAGQLSDDEVMEGEGEEEEEEEEGIGAWGSSRKDYYNADAIETEADALEEEAEAKKIQQKRLQSMKEADFGFDESEWLDAGEEEDGEKDDGVVTEVLPQLEITDDMPVEEQLKILKSRYPEFDPLGKDFIDLRKTHEELAEVVAAITKSSEKTDPFAHAPPAVVKFRILSAYLGTISLYFALLSSPAKDGAGKSSALPAAQLREHPIMNELVKWRKTWNGVKDIDITETISESEDVDEEMDDAEDVVELATIKDNGKQQASKAKSAQKKVSKAERAAQAARLEAEERRAEKLRQTEEGLADLSKLVDSKPSKKSKRVRATQDDNDSDFGDETGLTAREAMEKADKKKSLRFYTSQIAQKANKRGAAGRDAGGDADLPYRERLRDRQARLNAEAEKRGKRQVGDAERLGGDSDDEDRRVAGQLRGGSDGDDYYDMVTARSKQKKDDKKKLAQAQAEAAREGGHVEVQEQIGPDGKRAITYAIEKNKGLTPKRSKDVRNPRVKKRKKFEEKKKKLGSIRQVYKGGQGPGGYGGELTGIKKNLVKSVKL